MEEEYRQTSNMSQKTWRRREPVHNSKENTKHGEKKVCGI
jgi:hypothetical protein